MYTLQILAIFLFATIALEGASASTISGPKRSEKWDAYIQSLKDDHEERRARRQAGATEWENDRANCNPAEYTTHDSLGHRQSGLLAEPQDQGVCGSCWAFASVHTLTDQLSITQGSRQPLFSANYLNSCNKDANLVGNGTGNGCCGGKLRAGPKFFNDTGVVTADCSPLYSPTASDLKNNLPACPSVCSNGLPLSSSIFKTMDYKTLNSERSIFDALQAGKVVLALMWVTDTFIRTYKCGVYQDSTPDNRQYHVVEIVDFGSTRSTSGTNFWVVKNSWGNDFGEDGYFRIKRGDLGVGTKGIYLLPGSTTTPDDTQNYNNIDTFTVCGEVAVKDPLSNEMVMMVVEFVQAELIRLNSNSTIKLCEDGTTATGLSGASTMTVQTQVVSGTLVDIEMTVDVIGCIKATKVDITANVFIDLNENITLTMQNVSIQSSAKDLASFWWPWLLLTAILTVIFAQM